MKQFVLPAGAALVVLAPGVAAAKPPSAAHVRAYERAYHEVAHAYGRRAPGRNIVKDGIARQVRATDADVLSSLAVLERMLGQAQTPLAVKTAQVSTTAQAPAALTTTPSAGAGGVPGCASESGGNYSTGPANTNPSSGATGRYQITPSTAAGYGCSLATPAGQDACAQTIYAHQGAAAWVGCGG